MSMAWISLFVSVIFNIAAQYSLKVGMRNWNGVSAGHSVGTMVKGFVFNPWVVAGIIGFMLGLFAYSYSLSKIRLSMAYPVFTSGIVIGVTILSFWSLREPIRPIQIVGIALIMIGVWCVAAFAR